MNATDTRNTHRPSELATFAAQLLPLLAALGGGAFILAVLTRPDLLAAAGIDSIPDSTGLAAFAVATLFLLAGALIAFRRLGAGGAIALTGGLLWGAAMLVDKSYAAAMFLPLAGGFGGLVGAIASDRVQAETDPRLVYRQTAITRLTHWVWAIAVFFLVASGLQIFNARPNLYIGQQSGFAFENSILDIYAVNGPNGPAGQTRIFGQVFDTTGVLGMSGTAAQPVFTAFPAWATVPSFRDLATGRVVHFFFAWVLVGTLALWLINALVTGHLWRDIVLRPRDLRELPRDIVQHLMFRFTHGKSYTPLQKLAYFGVFVVAFPLVILTGLTMSPTMNSAWPFLLDLFGGRQTARTIHFFAMAALVLFFLVHVAMVVLAGPVNELRSMVTGYYRVSRPEGEPEGPQ